MLERRLVALTLIVIAALVSSPAVASRPACRQAMGPYSDLIIPDAAPASPQPAEISALYTGYFRGEVSAKETTEKTVEIMRADVRFRSFPEPVIQWAARDFFAFFEQNKAQYQGGLVSYLMPEFAFRAHMHSRGLDPDGKVDSYADLARAYGFEVLQHQKTSVDFAFEALKERKLKPVKVSRSLWMEMTVEKMRPKQVVERLAGTNRSNSDPRAADRLFSKSDGDHRPIFFFPLDLLDTLSWRAANTGWIYSEGPNSIDRHSNMFHYFLKKMALGEHDGAENENPVMTNEIVFNSAPLRQWDSPNTKFVDLDRTPFFLLVRSENARITLIERLRADGIAPPLGRTWEQAIQAP